MKYRFDVITLILFLFNGLSLHHPVFSQNPQTDFEKARMALKIGDYIEARDRFRPFLMDTTIEKGEPIQAYFTTFLEKGSYEEGLAEAESMLSELPENPYLLHMIGRFLVKTGAYQEALNRFVEAYQLRSNFPRNLLEIGDLLKLTGQANQAYRFYVQITGLHQDYKLQTAEDLGIAAKAYAEFEDFYRANEIFQTAYQLDPQNVQNLCWWADLFLDKYNNADARRTFEEALSINGHRADLLVAYGRSTESFASMEALAQKALKENPNSVEALNMLTEIAIIDADYAGAEEIVRQALAINPFDIRSLANLASIQHLTGDQEGYQQTELTQNQLNPLCGDFYFILADNCAKRFRYEDAVHFSYTAILKDRSHWKSYALLGSNLLRTGQREQAKQFLEYGFDGDPFNLFARNTLELIDEYENFTTLESDNFSLLIPKTESEVLGKSMLSLAEECFDSLSVRYPFTLQGKVQIEAYHDHDDFAVRISGLPGIGLLGVCFGDVVALDTPQAQAGREYNWAQTLWHELTHVVTLAISDHRIPRWFTEGLSVYEEMRARPQWGREMELQLFYALDHGLLLPLSEIDKGFTRPEFPEQVLLTYFQSEKYVEFLANRFGFEAIVDILRAYARGQNTEEAFRSVLSLRLEDAELLLLEDLRNMRARYAAALLDLPPLFSLPEEQPSAPRAITSDTRNPFFKAIYEGNELLEQEKYEEAEQKFLDAIEIFPLYTSAGNPYKALASIYLHNGEDSAAIDILIRYLNITEYGAEEAKSLGRIFQSLKNFEQAEKYYRQSLQVDPYDMDIRLRLAELYREQEDYFSEIDQRKAILALEPVDRSEAQYHLAMSLYHEGQIGNAKMEVLRALDLAPGFRDAQRLLLLCVGE